MKKTASASSVFISPAMVIAVLFLLLFSKSSYADCASPAGTLGTMVYNTDYHVPQYCDGTNWIGMGKIPGAGGAGCSSPTGTDGTFVYNTDCSVLQYCDGTSWKAMGSYGSPPVLTFTDQSSVGPPNAYSDILQVNLPCGSSSTSIAIQNTFSIYYFYRICSDAACNTEVQTWTKNAGTISSGQYVQLLIVENGPNATMTQRLILGGIYSNTWTVTFCDTC